MDDPGFESGSGWTEYTHGNLGNATSFSRAQSGIGEERSELFGYAITNITHGYLRSDSITVDEETDYDLYGWVRGEIDADASYATNWIIRARYYDQYGYSISYDNVVSGDATSLSETWTQEGDTITTPPDTKTVRVDLFFYNGAGWVAYDDISLTETAGATVTTYYTLGGDRVALRQGDRDPR